MSYAVIQPPFSLTLFEMPKKELKAYRQWFFDVMESRVAELVKAVNETPRFKSWQADYTPESLEQLGEWFARQAETRPRTFEELQHLEGQLKFPIEVSKQELTNRTFSLAMDIGMYLGQVFKKNHPFLQWEQPTNNKRFIDHGQLVLMGFGKVPFNPVGMTTVLAYGFVDKTRNGQGLSKIYAIWEKKISPAEKMTPAKKSTRATHKDKRGDG